MWTFLIVCSASDLCWTYNWCMNQRPPPLAISVFLSRNMTHACSTFQGLLLPLSHSLSFILSPSSPRVLGGTGVWIILESLLRKPDPSNGGENYLLCISEAKRRCFGGKYQATVEKWHHSEWFLSHSNDTAPQRQNRHLSLASLPQLRPLSCSSCAKDLWEAMFKAAQGLLVLDSPLAKHKLSRILCEHYSAEE